MPDGQGIVSAGRPVRLQTSTHGSAPTDGATEPDVTLSPEAPNGYPTTGVMVLLKAPTVGTAAVAGAGGFTVTPWIRNPVTRQWGSTSSFSADYGQWFETFDFNAVELYFQFANVSVAGGIDVHVAEQ